MKEFLESLKEQGYKYCVVGYRGIHYSTKNWNTKAFWYSKYIIMASEEPFTVRAKVIGDNMGVHADEEKSKKIEEVIGE